MKSNEEFIYEIYKKYDEYQKENKAKVTKKIICKRYTHKMLSVAAIFLIIFLTFIINQRNDLVLEENKGQEKEEISLATIDNFENFYNIIKNYNIEDMENKTKRNRKIYKQCRGK